MSRLLCAIVLVTIGCVADTKPALTCKGAEFCACYPNDTCDGDLLCSDGACIDPAAAGVGGFGGEGGITGYPGKDGGSGSGGGSGGSGGSSGSSGAAGGGSGGSEAGSGGVEAGSGGVSGMPEPDAGTDAGDDAGPRPGGPCMDDNDCPSGYHCVMWPGFSICGTGV